MTFRSTHLLFALTLVCHAPVSHAQEIKPDYPSMKASTGARGKKTEVSADQRGIVSRAQVHSLAVDVALTFPRPPQSEYDVQVFFFATDSETKEKFIYDSKVERSKEQSVKFEFQSEPLTGKTQSYAPGLRTPRTAAQAAVVPASTSKPYGWLVRVISAGEVVKIETNQGPLKDLHNKNPGIFNAEVE